MSTPPSVDEWQALWAQHLAPSRTLTALVETCDHLWESKAMLGEELSSMDLSRELENEGVEDPPRGVIKGYDKERTEVTARVEEVRTFVQGQIDTVLSLFEDEFSHAMEHVNTLAPEHRGEVIYDWGQAAHQVILSARENGRLSPTEKLQWSRQRISKFWDMVFKHAEPEVIQELPSTCVIKDWGVAMNTLIRRANTHSTLTPSLHAWLDALHQQGQQLDASWACSSPRQVMLYEKKDQLARDDRPSGMRRDNHYETSPTAAITAWSLWLDQTVTPAPHPATRDWVGALHDLTRPAAAQEPVEKKAQTLLRGLDLDTFLRWTEGHPADQRPGGETWENVKTLAQTWNQPELPGALLALARAQKVPAPPERSRRRYRP